MRPGVNRSYRVARSLKLVAPWQGIADELEAELATQIGFDCLELEGCRLKLYYDASKLHLDGLLERLAERGIVPDQGRWARMRLGWYRHTDSNIALNARDTSSTSCAQSPLRHR